MFRECASSSITFAGARAVSMGHCSCRQGELYVPSVSVDAITAASGDICAPVLPLCEVPCQLFLCHFTHSWSGGSSLVVTHSRLCPVSHGCDVPRCAFARAVVCSLIWGDVCFLPFRRLLPYGGVPCRGLAPFSRLCGSLRYHLHLAASPSLFLSYPPSPPQLLKSALVRCGSSPLLYGSQLLLPLFTTTTLLFSGCRACCTLLMACSWGC